MKGKAQQGGFSAGRGKKKREELVGDEGGLESLAHRIHWSRNAVYSSDDDHQIENVSGGDECRLDF